MAKNILLISIFDIDVERLFNIIHDVYYYRRNRFNLNMIEMIILIKWYEKLKLAIFAENSDLFDKKEEVIETKKEELSIDEQFIIVIYEEIE